MAKKEVIRYQARDGLVVEAYFTRPMRDSTNRPLIVLPHGGPHARDTWNFDAEVQFYASLGYAVLQPNYRVSLGYGHEHFRKGLREVGYAIQDDLFDAIRWANEQGYGRNGEVCISGSSFGGYAALRAATQKPDTFKCVISNVGFYDVVTLLEKDSSEVWYDIVTTIYGDPSVENDRKRLIDASPIHHIDKLSAPVLVMHGARDSVVEVAQAERLISELEKYGKEFESLIRPDEGHGFYKTSNRRRAFEKMGAFLSRHLPLRQSRSEPVPAGSVRREANVIN